MKRPAIGIISRRHSSAAMLDNLLWPIATRHLSPDEIDRRVADCDALLVDIAVVEEDNAELRGLMRDHPVVALFAPTLAATGKPWIFPCDGGDGALRARTTGASGAGGFTMQTIFVQLRDEPANDGEPHVTWTREAAGGGGRG